MSNPNLMQVQGPDDETDACDQCGGDGVIQLSEAGPGIWGEDVFCDEDRMIICPSCHGEGDAR